MRMLVTFQVLSVAEPLTQPDKHDVQAFWYDLLEGTEHGSIKHRQGYKFFCFSDLFPLEGLVASGKVHVVLSSPWERLVKTFHDNLPLGKKYTLGEWGEVMVREKKVFSMRAVGTTWITGSPIVVRVARDGDRSRYLTLDEMRPSEIHLFVHRLTENARKKFRAFYGMPPPKLPPEPLFTEFKYGKTVRIPVKFDSAEQPHVVVGTTWRMLRLPRLKTRAQREFYRFLMEVGLGERNSLGFGFVNVIKNDLKPSEQS